MIVDILVGDCRTMLPALPDRTFDTCVTSPPYFGLRDYGVDGQLGREQTPAEYVDALVGVMREVRRTLKNDGTLWLNIGDSYAKGRYGGDPKRPHMRTFASNGTGRSRSAPPGIHRKSLLGIPWRLAFAMQDDGWILRSEIVWAKPSCMPESVKDRPTASHEKVFLFAKSARYHYDHEAVREPAVQRPQRRSVGHVGYQADGVPAHQWAAIETRDEPAIESVDGRRNLRNVWNIATQPYDGAHFAVMPPGLAEPCIRAGSRSGRPRVLDPFGGAGTTGLVADRLGRAATLIEVNASYAALARTRIDEDAARRRVIAARSSRLAMRADLAARQIVLPLEECVMSEREREIFVAWDPEDYGSVIAWFWWEERVRIDAYGDELTWESAEDFWAREVRVGGGMISYGMRFAESDAEVAEAKIHFDLRVRETKRGLSEWRDDTFWDGERPTEEDLLMTDIADTLVAIRLPDGGWHVIARPGVAWIEGGVTLTVIDGGVRAAWMQDGIRRESDQTYAEPRARATRQAACWADPVAAAIELVGIAQPHLRGVR